MNEYNTCYRCNLSIHKKFTYTFSFQCFTDPMSGNLKDRKKEYHFCFKCYTKTLLEINLPKGDK